MFRDKKRLFDLLKVLVGVGVVALLSGFNFGKYASDIVQFTDVAAAKSKGMNEDAALIKCRALIAQKRRLEIYDIAERGYNTFHTSEWCFLYAKACAYRYEDLGDRAALGHAEKLYRAYVRELPYDPTGHIQLGWSLSHLGRRDESRAEFLKALALDPRNQVARNKLQYVQP